MTAPRKKPRRKVSAHSTSLQKLLETAIESGRINLNLFVQDQDWVEIEGDRASLAFLGNLLLAFAEDDGPDFLNLDNPLPLFKASSEGIILYRKL